MSFHICEREIVFEIIHEEIYIWLDGCLSCQLSYLVGPPPSSLCFLNQKILTQNYRLLGSFDGYFWLFRSNADPEIMKRVLRTIFSVSLEDMSRGLAPPKAGGLKVSTRGTVADRVTSSFWWHLAHKVYLLVLLQYLDVIFNMQKTFLMEQENHWVLRKSQTLSHQAICPTVQF